MNPGSDDDDNYADAGWSQYNSCAVYKRYLRQVKQQYETSFDNGQGASLSERNAG